MLQQLKRYSAKQKIHFFLAENRQFPEEKSTKIGIILDLDLVGNNFDLVELRHELDFPYEDFYPIVHSSQKPIPEKYSLEEFDGKNLGWYASFKTGSKEQLFQEMEYDLLLNYFNQPVPELLILSASAKARLKVGFPLDEKRLNDLEIAVDPKNHQLFAKELKKYLAVMKW